MIIVSNALDLGNRVPLGHIRQIIPGERIAYKMLFCLHGRVCRAYGCIEVQNCVLEGDPNRV